MHPLFRILLAGFALATSCYAQLTLGPSAPAAKMTLVTPHIAPPPAPVLDVRKFGAKGDGVSYDTAAIQKAIDKCAGTGGSVLLSTGKFLSAQLTLRGNMTFYIEKDAVLLGGTRPEDYPILVPNPVNNSLTGAIRRSLLYADLADKLVLDGGGVIDGQGAQVQMFGKEPERPSLLRIFNSNDVTVRNVSMHNPRMWTQVYLECKRLLLDNVKVLAPPTCENLDGMDICDCHDVVIRNCDVKAEDDGICLKTSSRTGLKNITITNNTVHCYRANAIKIGTSSRGPIENLQILENTVAFAKYGGLCLESVDGSVMSNVRVEGLDMQAVAQPFFIRVATRGTTRDGGKDKRPPLGSISNVRIERVRVLATHDKTAPSSTITAVNDGVLKNILFKNIYVEMPGGLEGMPSMAKVDDQGYPQSNIFGNPPGYAFYVKNAQNIVFEDVSIGALKRDVRPWLKADKSEVQTVRCEERK